MPCVSPGCHSSGGNRRCKQPDHNESCFGQDDDMEFEDASRELYGLVPSDFTTARDAKVAEARAAGDRELASALRKLRKPSVGAWLANQLAREEPRDVNNLVELGTNLRAPRSKLEGEQIRKISREKSEVISKLVRDAKSLASRLGHPVSTAVLEDLEGTLEAAFADPKAAEHLRTGQLTSGLQYSGLGLVADSPAASPATDASSLTGSASRAALAVAQRDLAKANRDLESASTELARARRAVADTAMELKRLKSAEALAARRSSEAEKRVVAATKKLQRF